MNPRLCASVLLPLAALLGCASGISPTSPSSSPLNLNGNWEALANPASVTLLASPIAEFTGALESNSAGIVTGTLRAFASPATNPCVPFTQDLAATGNLDATDTLTLTIPIAGGTATLVAKLPQNPEAFTPATWQIAGGACAMPLTQVTLAEYASATGTYTGIFNALNTSTNEPIPGTATSVTAVLTQSATPNADGQFPFSGNLTLTGACAATFPLSGVVTGAGLLETFINQGIPTQEVVLVLNPTASTLAGSIFPFTACGNQVFQGSLTRQ